MTVEYVLRRLKRICESDEVAVKDQLAALKMVGDHLKMFEKENKVTIDVRRIVAQMTTADLKRITANDPVAIAQDAESIKCQ